MIGDALWNAEKPDFWIYADRFGMVGSGRISVKNQSYLRKSKNPVFLRSNNKKEAADQLDPFGERQ